VSRSRDFTNRRAKARREYAMERHELRRQTLVPHVFPAGATSAPIKAADSETRRLIDEALARRVR
jgi:hypothetical protein